MFLCVQLCVPIMNALFIPMAYDFFFSYYIFFLQKNDSFKKCVTSLKDDMEILIG